MFPILTIGSFFRWPSYGQGAYSSAESFFELAEEAVGSERSSGVRIGSQAGEGSFVDLCIQLVSPLVVRDHAIPPR